MSSTRASEVAEALFELKRADKVATYSAIARRAGFSAGVNGRAVKTALKTIRRDWPHLQWWRAIDDTTVIEEAEQVEMLQEIGMEFDNDGKSPKVSLNDEQLMDWSGGTDGTQAASV